MIHITTGQAAVLTLLRKGVRRNVIAQQLDKDKSTVYRMVNRLIVLGIITETEPGKYAVTGKPYAVCKVRSGAATVPVEIKRPTPNNPVTQIAQPVSITPKQATYILQHVATKPRSQMARELGVDKVTLNLMIMQLRGVETS